jgi:type IV pilus assembly protein PilZ
MSSTQPRYPSSLQVVFPEVASSGRATNISSGGVFVRTDRRFDLGAVLSLALELPDGAPPAAVHGKVVHARPPRRAPEPGVGLQFVSAGDEFRVRLDRYIQTIAPPGGPPVRLLLIARDLLHEQGWTQLADHVPLAGYCMTGALRWASGDDREAYVAALECVGRKLGVPPCPHGGFRCHCAVMSWNDQDGRTKKDVIAKLDEAIQSVLGTAA